MTESPLARLRERQEWKFFGVLPKADLPLTVLWWTLLLLSGIVPAVFAIATGVVVGVVAGGGSLVGPLLFAGVLFLVMQLLPPVLQAVSMNLGSRVSAWLNDTLARTCVEPPGIAHLEDPALAEDLTVAREFDRGMTGPPMFLNVDFIAAGLLGLIGGVASAIVLVGFAWWAPLVLVACWAATHWLLRESGVWSDRNTPEVRAAQRHADYAYRLATDPAPAKELRLFGLAGWVVERFVARRQRLFELQYRATRLREKSVLLCLLIVLAGNAAVFGALGLAGVTGGLTIDRIVVFAQSAVGVSLIAFGGLNWALDGAAAPVAAVLRLEGAMRDRGALARPTATPQVPAGHAPVREIRFRGVTFRYPGTDRLIFDRLDLTIPAGGSLAIVGQNGAGKTTLAKLLCRLYDPDDGSIEVDGVDLRDLDLAAWRQRITAVFQDFVRFELPLRENVAPAGPATDDELRAALTAAGADGLAGLDTVLAKGYPGGTDLSGGQWQRVALARALHAVRTGAGLVLLDEPTAQLDVRGELAIFERVLAATRSATTILISHRFSTVRLADRICVLEHGRVIEQGSHDELITLGGRYRTMYQLQARRFDAGFDEEGVAFDVLG
ncbi:ABC transporter ATP-binding protein [Microlunatus parietis]|uniref:ATP-binding cassette subfamily C protein n=1 Tax=Microlunatus parietis TaxID=682979 RepID=A0A7Y9I4H5_9ACTN|nr:ABC transporter ATP-binding protein [Microlunatus parietis]NYE69891.1 ATP-binding cassette subfamily C protein [Microlunatus parietis]